MRWKQFFPKNISLTDMSFGVNFILTNWEATKVVRMWTRADFEQSLFFSIFFRAKRARNENDHARGRKSLVSRVATQRLLRVCTPLTESKKMRDAHSRLRRGHLVKLLNPRWYPYVTEYFSSFVLFSRMEIDGWVDHNYVCQSHISIEGKHQIRLTTPTPSVFTFVQQIHLFDINSTGTSPLADLSLGV